MSDRTNNEEATDRNAGVVRWAAPLAVGFLTCLVASVFWPIPGFEFINFDVHRLLVDNPHVRGLTAENLKQIFTTRCVTSYYPVRTLTFALDYQLWGMNPGGFKLTNGLLHLANVLLVFWLILRLFRHPSAAGQSRRPVWDVSVAAFSAGLFAIHPVVVEPVTWVPGREELLMTLGAISCFHFHLTARRLEASRRIPSAITYFAVAALCCAAACLSNSVAAVIPLLVTAWDLLMLDRPRVRRIFCGTWALWVVGVVTVVIKRAGDARDLFGENTTALAGVLERLGQTGEVVTGEVGVFSVERLLLVANVYWLNLKSLVWPTDLTVFYGSAQPRSFPEMGVVLGGLAIAVSCCGLWLVRRRKLILFGLVWFALALAPTAQVMPHHIHRADRFLYLPLVGLALAVAVGLRPLAPALKRRAVGGAVIVAGLTILLLLCAQSAGQVRTWRTKLSVWEHCIAVAPHNDLAHRHLADTLVQAGQFDRAFAHYRAALKIGVHVEVLDNYSRALMTCDDGRPRDYPLAIKMAEMACELTERDDPKVLHTLATAHHKFAEELRSHGDFGRAIDHLHKAVEADPEYAAPAFNLALLLATCADVELRDADESVRLAERACRTVARPNSNHLMILAVTYAEAGRAEMAMRTTERAIRRAEAEGNRELADLLRRRLKLYRGGVSPESPPD